MAIALVYPASQETEAQSLDSRMRRFSGVEHFTLSAGETVVDAFSDACGCAQALFFLTAPVTPRASREEWGGILEHLEQHRDPPLAFYCPSPLQVPAAVRRGAFLADRRAVDSWAASHFQLPGDTLARLPWFSGRELELARLHELLVDQPGAVTLTGPALCGKTALAQHFARVASPYFQSVEWILDGRPLPASAISTRSLYVIDAAEEPYSIPPGNSSVLLTARTWNSGPSLSVEPVPLPEIPTGPDLATLALFRPSGFHRAVCGLTQESLAALAERRLLDPIDAAGDWFRLPWPTEPAEEERPRWARAVHQGLLDARHRRAWLPEAFAAYRWAAERDWNLAPDLGRRAARQFESEGRLSEAAQLWQWLELDAHGHAQPALAAEAASSRAWLINEHTGAYRRLEPGDQLPLFT